MYQEARRRTRLIVTGGRKFVNYAFLRKMVDRFIETYNIDKGDLEIVSGGEKGADRFGEMYARANDLPLRVFRASRRFKDGAGRKRNSEMVDYATHCIVFPVYKSSIDSYDMAQQALWKELILEIWELHGNEVVRIG